jgi:hypothetical protein
MPEKTAELTPPYKGARGIIHKRIEARDCKSRAAEQLPKTKNGASFRLHRFFL